MTDPAATTFPAGVASFDPTADAVIIWTALAGVGSCTWEVATDEEFTAVVASATAVGTSVGAAAVVSVDVTGLAPGRTHWYRFLADGRTSPIGRTRTLPARGADRLRLGVTCCARFGQSEFQVYRQLATADVDLVVHLGDYIYEDTKCDVEGREPVPDHDCVSLADYRERHLQCRADPDLQRLHQQHPMVVIWDDHDLADNAYSDGAANHDGTEQGPWHDRMDAALQAQHEFLPKRLADDGDVTTPWRRLDAGDLLSLVCTETRAHRDEQAGREGAAPADDPDRTMLGRAQREWLLAALEDPAPHWTFLLSGTVVSELSIDAPDELDGLLPEKYAVHEGRAINTDQWDGYLAERGALVAAARRRGGRTVVLSGDIHSAWAIEGPADDQGAVAIELTCPPAATTPLGQLLPPGGGALLATTVVDQLDQVRWMSGDHRGYMVVDVTRERVHVNYWWVTGPDDAEVHLGRRWEVPAGDLPVRLADPEPWRAERVGSEGDQRSRKAVVAGAVAGGVAVAAAAAAAVTVRARRSANITG